MWLFFKKLLELPKVSPSGISKLLKLSTVEHAFLCSKRWEKSSFGLTLCIKVWEFNLHNMLWLFQQNCQVQIWSASQSFQRDKLSVIVLQSLENKRSAGICQRGIGFKKNWSKVADGFSFSPHFSQYAYKVGNCRIAKRPAIGNWNLLQISGCHILTLFLSFPLEKREQLDCTIIIQYIFILLS